MKRTKRSMINIITSIIPSFIIIILAFFKFKYFISLYGDDMNGIVQLVAQIYAYLALAELGFGAATNIKLYKYFQEESEEKIAKVFNESRILYFKSGMFIFVFGILLSFVLPFFIKNNTVETYYIIAIMILYAVDFAADYLYGLPYRNLLIVDEKIYVINLVKTTQQIIFKIIEIILILNHVNILVVISISVFTNFLSSFLLAKIAKKYYPYLKKYKERDRTVSKSVKDIVVNNIADVVNEKTDSIVIANQMGLKDTSIYSMYNLITNYIYTFMLNFVSGVKSSIGVIVNNQTISKDECYMIFKQFLNAINYISLICLIMFSVSASSFMSIFIDKTYSTIFGIPLLFGIVLWLNVILKTLHVIVEVKGYFKNIKWMALVQAIMNIILSLILVNIYGIFGVLLATVLTSTLLLLPIKAKVAFAEFDKSPIYFYILLLFSMIISMGMIYVIKILNVYNNIQTIIEWFAITFVVGIIVSIILFIYFFVLFKDFRGLIQRIMNSSFLLKIKNYFCNICSKCNRNKRNC